MEWTMPAGLSEQAQIDWRCRHSACGCIGGRCKSREQHAVEDRQLVSVVIEGAGERLAFETTRGQALRFAFGCLLK